MTNEMITHIGGKRVIGKVARIIDAWNLVINRGSEDGVDPTARFWVVYVDGDCVVDPDTQEPLEPVEIVRGRGRVTRLQRKIATITSDRQRRVRSKRSAFESLWPSTTATSVADYEDLPFDKPAVGDYVILDD